MPGSNARALETAHTLPGDVLVLDLEDAVALEMKLQAPAQVVTAVRAGGYGHREIVVRVNALGTSWGRDDIAAAAASSAGARHRLGPARQRRPSQAARRRRPAVHVPAGASTRGPSGEAGCRRRMYVSNRLRGGQQRQRAYRELARGQAGGRRAGRCGGARNHAGGRRGRTAHDAGVAASRSSRDRAHTERDRRQARRGRRKVPEGVRRRPGAVSPTA